MRRHISKTTPSSGTTTAAGTTTKRDEHEPFVNSRPEHVPLHPYKNQARQQTVHRERWDKLTQKTPPPPKAVETLYSSASKSWRNTHRNVSYSTECGRNFPPPMIRAGKPRKENGALRRNSKRPKHATAHTGIEKHKTKNARGPVDPQHRKQRLICLAQRRWVRPRIVVSTRPRARNYSSVDGTCRPP